jgi:hypothetical protein
MNKKGFGIKPPWSSLDIVPEFSGNNWENLRNISVSTGSVSAEIRIKHLPRSRSNSKVLEY